MDQEKVNKIYDRLVGINLSIEEKELTKAQLYTVQIKSVLKNEENSKLFFLISLIGEEQIVEDILNQSKHFKEIYDGLVNESDWNITKDAKELKEKLLKLKPLVKIKER